MKTYLSNWKKGFFLILTSLILSLTFVFLSASAANAEFSYIDDPKGAFSEDLKTKFNERYRNVLKKYGSFLMVAVGEETKEDSRRLAEEYLDSNGISEKHTLALLYLNLHNHTAGLAVRGGARDIFLPEYNELFEERMNESLSENPSDYETVLNLYENYGLSVLKSAGMEKIEVPEVKNYVDDTQNYFSEEAIAKANERLSRADALFDADIRITVQKSCDKDNIDLSAIRYIEEHKLGEEREASAFLLYISKKPRKFSLMARDRAQDIFSESVREDIFEAMLPFMKENRYDEALDVFIDLTVKGLTTLSVRKALSISEREEGLYFYDNAKNPYSDTLYREINEKLAALSEEKDTDIIVYVEGNGKEGNLTERVLEFAIKNRLGDGKKNDAVILYIDINREWCFVTGRGRGLRFLAGKDNYREWTVMNNLFDVKDYEPAIWEFIDKIDSIITKHLKRELEKERGLDLPVIIGSGLMFGGVVGSIAFLLFYLSISRRAKANLTFDYKSTIDYVGGAVFSVKNDTLIRTTTSREYDKKDDYHDRGSSSSSSYSSSSYSSGGSSYGGTSGDY